MYINRMRLKEGLKRFKLNLAKPLHVRDAEFYKMPEQCLHIDLICFENSYLFTWIFDATGAKQEELLK